ncbi:MAG: hypothetical protein PHV23_00895 [Candidatus Gracilibacteria bacterium]|nr:hypothetical protein [Candidatus Gracilibacteria bacterium]
MLNIYRLQIHCGDNNIETISNILELNKYKNIKWEHKIELDRSVFEFEVEEKENEKYFNYIDFFLNILEDKYDLLEKIGINRNDITIWRLYRYNNQCNMEWNPKDLKRLGDSGISLCVSCWEE